MTNFASTFFGKFFLLVLLALVPSSTFAIDDDHPLRQYLKSKHMQVAGSATLTNPDTQARAVQDFRKRFEQHRLALLEQEQANKEQGIQAEE